MAVAKRRFIRKSKPGLTKGLLEGMVKKMEQSMPATGTSRTSGAPNQSRGKFGLKTVVLGLAALVLVAILAGLGYFFNQYRQLSSKSPTVEKPSVAGTETGGVIEAVARLMELPQGETPAVATIKDKEKLADQPFFQEAENGDKLLVYPQAGKAILYRPSTGKIIDVSPFAMDQELLAETAEKAEESPTPTPEPEEEQEEEAVAVTVYLYNGTETAGLTFTVEALLASLGDEIAIVDRDNAVKQDYEKTLVVDLSGKNQKKAQEIADLLDAEVVGLPAGEAKPEADILIVVGKDKK